MRQAVYTCVGIGLMAASLAASQVATFPVFEVASLKRSTSAGVTSSGGVSASGLVTFNNMSIRELIRRAYDLPRFDRVLGGPEWIDTERYDFTGRAEAET